MIRQLYLSLGSNLGDKKANIKLALSMLEQAFGQKYDALSSLMQTEAWGFEGEDFVNCVVRFVVELEPEQVLSICKDIEYAMGRRDAPEYDAEGKRLYHNRIIDIDILLYGDLSINTPSLVIPHPQIENRDFVRTLLCEVR